MKSRFTTGGYIGLEKNFGDADNKGIWNLEGVLSAVYASASPPTVESSSSATSTTNISKPSGTVSGDVLIGFFYNFFGDATLAVPSGFTAIGSAQLGSGYPNIRMLWGRKVAGGSEPSSYSFTANAGSYPCAMMLRISGASTSTNGPNTVASGNNSTRNFNSLAVTADSSLVILGTVGWETTPSTPTGFTQEASTDGGVSALFSKTADTSTVPSGTISSSGGTAYYGTSMIAIHTA